MTALSDALVAAQRRAIAGLAKDYIAKTDPDPGELWEALDAIGCTDKVEQRQLALAWTLISSLGAQAPEPTKPAGERAMAEPRQMKYAQDLADKAGTVLPDYQLTKANASKIIDQLKAGTYNPDEWTVPF